MQKKNKTLAIVLALFLGGFGAHWFYLERPIKGLAYFVMCWTLIPAFLSLFTAIYWLTLSDETWREKNIRY